MTETFESGERFASNVGSGAGVHTSAIVLAYYSVCTLQGLRSLIDFLFGSPVSQKLSRLALVPLVQRPLKSNWACNLSHIT